MICVYVQIWKQRILEKLNAKNIKFEGNIKLINEIDFNELKARITQFYQNHDFG